MGNECPCIKSCKDVILNPNGTCEDQTRCQNLILDLIENPPCEPALAQDINSETQQKEVAIAVLPMGPVRLRTESLLEPQNKTEARQPLLGLQGATKPTQNSPTVSIELVYRIL